MNMLRLLRNVCFLAVIPAALFFQAEPVPAQESSAPSGKSAGETNEMPVYKPPLRGAPAGRLSGGTRSAEDNTLIFVLLAPRHTGRTISEAPTLYWFSSETVPYPVELTVLMGKEMKPILQRRIANEAAAGFHPIRLADLGIRLQTGTVYQCFLSLVTDPQHPSKDVISGGTIERIAPSREFQKKLQETKTGFSAHVYAAEGIWYDAVSALCTRIAAAPKDDGILRQQRSSLLRQGDLGETADYEAKHPLPTFQP